MADSSDDDSTPIGLGLGHLPLKRVGNIRQQRKSTIAMSGSLPGRARVPAPVPSPSRTKPSARSPSPSRTKPSAPASTPSLSRAKPVAPVAAAAAAAASPSSIRRTKPPASGEEGADADADADAAADAAIASPHNSTSEALTILRREYPHLNTSAIKTRNPNPAGIAPPFFVPSTSPGFTNFIWFTYGRYSQQIIADSVKGGVASASKVKGIDQDACKRRDPNKIETFYYQKFVRDYLGGGTPYRGLLVYHGLGSGKTCTSIAAAEALIWGGKKTIWILTPATLGSNFRRELGKCGFFPLRRTNLWRFMEIDPVADRTAFTWVTQGILGLPPDTVRSQKGAWIPNPDAPSNWDSLSAAEHEAIEAQQKAHLVHRFKFIHYNGISPAWLAEQAAAGARAGTSIFDNSVILVDEIHNLVRTINGTRLGGKTVAQIIDGGTEPREATWSTPFAVKTSGYRYPRGYSLYRLLTNAVGAKIIALSATPMINYAQELAILMNIIGGESRAAEINGVSRATNEQIKAWSDSRPDVDYCVLNDKVLTVTPVPFGFAKTVDPETAGRHFKPVSSRVEDYEVIHSRERNMNKWATSLVVDLVKKKLMTEVVVAPAPASASASSKAAKPASPFTIQVYPILPEDDAIFIDNFVDRATLEIKNSYVLKARISGLVSFYRGGGDELMPRTICNDIVRVPMSAHMFKEYITVRKAELDMESPEKKKEGASGTKKLDIDLYALATKPPQTGFLALSRAACNWTFPDEIERPRISSKDKAGVDALKKILGVAKKAKKGRADAPTEDEAMDEEEDVDVEEDMTAEGVVGQYAVVEEAKPDVLDVPTKTLVAHILRELEADSDKYLNANLADYSPKYAAMIHKIRESPGPVLVYSQFLTLEGLGIFAAALRASPEHYYELDIVKQKEGEWKIPDEIMEKAKNKDNRTARRPRYIMYTGAQSHEKRRLLLQLYNADIAGLPTTLSEQCKKLLRYGRAEDNRAGDVCRAFMITASGSEGISLVNTRQVHIMEPYWNNVRLQQVIGRAIRLCSHMNLPWDDRTVGVYTYLSVFTETQKTDEAREVMTADKRMTTDEVIFDIATKKQKLADGLFEIAQSAAVDCSLHHSEHGGITKCFKFAASKGADFISAPNWQTDLSTMVRSTAAGAGAGAGSSSRR